MNQNLFQFFEKKNRSHKKVMSISFPRIQPTHGPWAITAASDPSSNTFQSGLTRKQKKIFALVKLMKKLNDRRSFFTAKIPDPEFETKPTPRPKNKDRGQIWGHIENHYTFYLILKWPHDKPNKFAAALDMTLEDINMGGKLDGYF